jgi:predicted membrane-bound mannosyltransferase
MMRKFAAALIAASLIAGPVLAQGTSQGTPTTASQPAVKADVKKAATKKHVHKITKSKMHAAKAVKHVKHAKHVKHIKHVKRVKPATEQTRG